MPHHASEVLEENVDECFRSQSLGVYDCNGLMLHVLECLGSIRLRIKNDQSGVSNAMKRVFRSACNVMLDHIVEDLDIIDNVSALKYLLRTFPDDKKRKDGRSWLPLHWASACDMTDKEDIEVIVSDRPLNAKMSYVGGVTKIETDRKANYDYKSDTHDHDDYTEGKEDEDEVAPDERVHEDQSISNTVSSKVSSDMGLLPLHFVASLRNPRLANAQHILNTYPDAVRIGDKKGWLPIHWCAKNCSNVDVIQLLINQYPQSVYEPTYKGQLPFQLALQNRDTSIMELLLKYNPDALESIDNKGNTCLHDAVRYCNPYGVTRLLKFSSELALIKNFDKDELPVHKLFNYLPNKGGSRLKWHQTEVLKLLIEYHPETIAMTDKEGSLPLHLAVYFNANIEIIELLVQTYPSGSLLRDNYGKLPLDYTEDSTIRRKLMGASSSLVSLGITDSFMKLSL